MVRKSHVMVTRLKLAVSLVPIAAAVLMPSQFAQGASATWKASGHTDSLWQTGSNWVGGAAAGAVGSTVSDTATFNGPEGLSVIVDQTRNIGSLAFDTADAGAFTISAAGAGSSGLYLTTAGSVSVGSSVLNTQTVSAPLFTRTSSAHAFSFTNNSVNSGVSLVMAGDFNHRSSSATALTLDGDGNGLVSGDLVDSGSGSFNITKNGTGTWTLSGTNTHNNTTVSAGRLNLENASALGVGQVTLSGGTIDNTTGSELTLSANNTVVIGGTGFGFGGTNNLVFGTGSVTYSTTKAITLNGTGKTLRFQGALLQNNDGATATMTVSNGVGASGNQLIFEGGGGINTGGNSQRINVFNGDASITINGTIYNRTSSTTGNVNNGITYNGTGKLTLGGDNAFTGVLTASSGTVQIGTGGTTGSLAGTGSVVNNSTLIFDRSSDSTLTRVISGSGDLTKRGAGELLLTRVNTFTGDTVIEGGSIVLDSVGTIANSDTITIGAGASLDVSAKTTFAMAAAQEFTFDLNPAGSGSAGRIEAAELNITNAVVDFNLLGSLNDGVYVIASYTSLVGTEFASEGTLPGAYWVDYAYNNGTQIAVVVPEPASLGLLGLASALLVRRRGRFSVA